MTYKYLRVAILILVLHLPFSAQNVTEDQVRITTPSAPWTIVISGRDLDVRHIGVKPPGGSSAYVMMVDETHQLNVSLYIEPAVKCKTSDSCRDFVLGVGNPAWGKYQNLKRSKIGDFSYFEFFRPEVRGMPLRMQDMYAQYVGDGYWVDLHISKTLYSAKDKVLFEDMVRSLKFVSKQVGSDRGSLLAESLEKHAKNWLLIWDAGKCGDSYDNLTSFSREAVSKEEWSDYCAAQRQAMGKLVSRNLIAMSISRLLASKPGHSAATLRFESLFENSGLITEFVSLTREKDGLWTISNHLYQR